MNRYINGHSSKGNSYRLGGKHTEEWKRITSERMKGNKHGLGSKHPHTEETKQKIRIAGAGNKNALGHKFVPSEKWKQQNSEKMIGNKYALGHGHPHTKERREEASKRMKELWADPVWHKAASKRMRAGHNRGTEPNKKETKLLGILEFLQPGDWKYVGDGSVIFGTKNPDFININGKKQIIELYGDYWHKGQDPQDRIDIFEPFGFSTLVIWERELKHIPKLIGRIQEFTAP